MNIKCSRNSCGYTTHEIDGRQARPLTASEGGRSPDYMYSCPPLTTAVVIVYGKYTIHTQLMMSNALPGGMLQIYIAGNIGGNYIWRFAALMRICSSSSQY